MPPDHLVRQIDGILDLSWVHKELAPYYSHTGRPSIDPVLMIRMLIIGYVFAIRSERALCRDVQVNFAYRWSCGLSIEDKIPDHSACGEGFAVDASLIVADANKQRSIPGSEWSKELDAQEASRAARVSRHTRRRGIRGGERCYSEVRVAVRSSRTMDGRDARTGVLCLRR